MYFDEERDSFETLQDLATTRRKKSRWQLISSSLGQITETHISHKERKIRQENGRSKLKGPGLRL